MSVSKMLFSLENCKWLLWKPYESSKNMGIASTKILESELSLSVSDDKKTVLLSIDSLFEECRTSDSLDVWYV